jgi:hypothetical protein
MHIGDTSGLANTSVRAGREIRADKCNCPFHADGNYRGERPRESLRTRNRHVADQKIVELVRSIDARLDAPVGNQSSSAEADVRRSISDAVERFLASLGMMDESKGFPRSRRVRNISEIPE